MLLVQYSVYPLVIHNGLWLSGLSCLFHLQIYCPILKVVGSNPTFILSIQIRNYPTPHMYVQLPHLGKSAVQPKTTSLCSSITVITLW